MEALVLHIYNFFSKNKAIFWSVLLLAFLPILFLTSQLKLDEDITKILPGNKDSKQYNQSLKDSKIMDKLVIRIALKDSATVQPDRLSSYAATFVDELESRKDLQPLIREVRHRLPEDMMLKAYSIFYNNLPFFLEQQDYLKIDSAVTEAGVARNLEKDYHILVSPMSMVIKEQIKKDPLHFTALVLSKLQTLQISNKYKLYDSYIVSNDHKSLLLFISPANPASESVKNGKLIDGIDAIAHKLSLNGYSDVDLEYFGAAAMAVVNARQIQKDILITVSIALISICLLLWIYFRKASLPLIILLPIAFGMAFALTIIYLYKQHISAIALGAGGVIIGIAVNYSLHVFTHYKHTRSIAVVIKDLSLPLFIGSTSTIGAFFSLLFVNSEILFDFGLFSGLSLIGTILFTLLFLPQFLIYYNFKESHDSNTWMSNVIAKADWLARPYYKYMFLLIVAISVLFFFTYRNVQFENDLNALSYMTPQLKKAEQDLNVENNKSKRSIYLLFKGKNLNEAIKYNEEALGTINNLINKHAVYKYSGITSFITSGSATATRKALWDNYWTLEKKTGLKKTIEQLAPQYGFKANAFDGLYALLDKNYTIISSAELATLKEYFLKEYLSNTDGNIIVMASLEIPAEQSTFVYEKLSSLEGLFVLDKQHLIKKFISIVEADFNQILYTSSLLVFSVLLLFYGRIELALITFIPMLISWLWILGFMSLFDLRFNIVNIIISTFIFGLGDDYSIFMMDGLLMEYKDGTRNLSSYKVAILLSAITTLLGMGVLIFAQHPALRSIAVISVVGILCVLFISYTLIPIIFRALISNRVKKGLGPITLISFIWTLAGYIVFLIGSFSLIVCGFLLFKILRLKGARVRLFYHFSIRHVTRSLMYSIFYAKKRYINECKEDLTKPAIIVLNHQSILDILLVLAAHPKVILFVKDWVWDSIFLGPIARMAGFYNVTDGAEKGLEVVKERISEGYSIVIFPEGSRSEHGQIRRFHKGAFLLAQELQLDILPVVIHGTGYCISSKDFLLRKGILTVKILPRITYDNKIYGASYQEQCKSVRKLMIEEYKKVNANMEPSFFYNQLLQKYVYKGPLLVWQIRFSFWFKNNYKILNDIIPLQGTIYEVGCNYGFLSYVLAFASSGRIITGIDSDEEKIKMANLSKYNTDNISFTHSNSRSYLYDNADAIIINNSCKNSEERITLIRHCIANLNNDGVLILLENNTKETLFSSIISRNKRSVNSWRAVINTTELSAVLSQLNIKTRCIDSNSGVICILQK